MRKPRDFDSELKALADKAKQLKERRVRDLGALVTATGADTLDADVLAGALLDAAATPRPEDEGEDDPLPQRAHRNGSGQQERLFDQ